MDASFGFEMEIFEFLNICQVHGFPKIMGVLTHLDHFRNNKALRKTKKRLKHRFWTEVYQVRHSRVELEHTLVSYLKIMLLGYSEVGLDTEWGEMAFSEPQTSTMLLYTHSFHQGAKLFYLSGMVNGEYQRTEVQNLGRFISVMKFRPLQWRTTHPYLLTDRSDYYTKLILIIF